MKLKILFFTLFVSLTCINICFAANDKKDESNLDSYLSKPTGKYGVGFKDFHWINKNVCPDFNYNGKNKSDFSLDNKKHCHEIAVRIYYPTMLKTQVATPYYQPFIKSAQNDFKKIPGITSEQIQQLDKITSYSIKNAPILTKKIFSVLIFSPGAGVQTQLYENIINELVSHGYIVVGVNTFFINGGLELPNGHVVKAAMVSSRDEANKKFLPMQMQDVIYIFKKIHVLHHLDAVFSAMDLKHIGIFGHSIGGKSVENIVQVHPDWFQAAATLDVAFYKDEPIKKSVIPFMHIISAYWESFFSWPLIFELGNNGYLVTLSPSLQNKHYSYHMNYSDYSTLQYLPAFQTSLAYGNKKQHIGEDVKMMSRQPTMQEVNNFSKPTYVLIKTNNKWNLFYYNSGNKNKKVKIGIDFVAGLEKSLSNLPKKIPEQLTVLDIKPIQNAITSFHLGFGNSLGTGNGWKITHSVNTYLVQFFNTFLKNKKNPAFKNCTPLSSDTMLKCGPGTFGDEK